MQFTKNTAWSKIFTSPFLQGIFLVVLIVFSIINSRDVIKNKTFGAKFITYSDAEGYYLYLPALFIYHGFNSIPVRSPGQFPTIKKTGNVYDKYTFGVAILELPFFLVADAFATRSNDQRDGYSKPYQAAIAFAGIFYGLLGLYIIFLVLKIRFHKVHVLLGLVAVLFGTNLLHYILIEPGMSHIYSFFLIASMMFYTPRIYADPSWKRFLLFSIIVGLIVFIRPSNIVVVLYYLFYQVSSMTQLKERMRYFWENLGKHFLLVIPFLVLFTIQILIWKDMVGEWVIFSYSNEPGFIYWSSPKMLNVLFHVHNGLFIYAPVLLLAVVGLIIGLVQKRSNSFLILIILLLSTYIFGSWWAWWFGGAYGHRCYVELLPFFVCGLVFLSQTLDKSRFRMLQIGNGGLLVIFIFYSLKLMAKYLPPWDGPGWTWDTWWEAVSKII
jgi:hypothetical protein